tara:strand:- start:3633 stop:4091 length:459 start_codon:yes stop_codon:yes gene_type:complete
MPDNIKCEYCEEENIKKENIKKHQLTKKCIKKRNNKLRCSFCNQQFEILDDKQNHENILKCDNENVFNKLIKDKEVFKEFIKKKDEIIEMKNREIEFILNTNYLVFTITNNKLQQLKKEDLLKYNKLDLSKEYIILKQCENNKIIINKKNNK